MTLTSSVPRAPWLRRAAAWVAAAAVIGCALGSPTAARAATSTELDDHILQAAPLGAGVTDGESNVTVSIAITNSAAEDMTDPTVTVALGTDALDGREAISGWLDDAIATGDFSDVATTTLSTLERYSSMTAAVTIDADDADLESLEPGVYPLRTTVEQSSGATQSTSVIVVTEPDDADPSVDIVVPVTADPRGDGLLSEEELATLTAEDGALTELLDAVRDTSAILAIDPAVVAAIRVLGTSAPQSARDWLQSLLDLPNERFALQFADADVAVQLDAGLSEPIQPEALTSYLDSADFLEPPITPTAAPAEAPSPTPTPAQLPAVEQLLDVRATHDSVYWPATGTAGDEAVATLGELDGSVTLVPSSTVAGSTSAHASVGGADLLVYDSDVSTALTDTAIATGVTARAAGLAEARAYLSLSSDPVLAVIDRPSAIDSSSLRDALTTGREETPGLSGLLFAPADEVTVQEVVPDQTRVDALRDLMRDAETLTEFASILDDPSLLTSRETATILQLLSNGWRPMATQWDAAVAAHREQSRETLRAVEITPPTDINLLGSSAPLVFSVRNELEWPVSVVLVATPRDPLLVVQNTTSVSAGAAQNTRVEVPVEARVGSGEARLGLQLRSPTSVEIGPSRTVEVAVRAEWEGFGIAALITIVSILLILGIVRTVLRARARHRSRGDAA